MSRKARNIVITILLAIAGIGLIGYGLYVSMNKEVDVVEQAKPDFTDTGIDYNGNKWVLEAYNNEDGKYVMLEIYMEEDHNMKWYGTVASGAAEINYIIYQNDHYVMSINPNIDRGDSSLGFLFDNLEPNHSKTATYLYYGLDIVNTEEGIKYHTIGGELIDEVTPATAGHNESGDVGLNPVEPEFEVQDDGFELNPVELNDTDGETPEE